MEGVFTMPFSSRPDPSSGIVIDADSTITAAISFKNFAQSFIGVVSAGRGIEHSNSLVREGLIADQPIQPILDRASESVGVFWACDQKRI